MLKPVFSGVKEFRCSDLHLNAIDAPAGNKIWPACYELALLLYKWYYKNKQPRPKNFF